MNNYSKPKYDIGDRFKSKHGKKWKTITAVYSMPNQPIKYCLDGHYSDLLEENQLDLGLEQNRIIYKRFL